MKKSRQAVVLAGGFGTRLAHVVSDVPKPMAPVAGRPFLRFVLDLLADNGFSRVVIADGYKRELIEGFFGDTYRGLELVYSSEDTPLLTGGAVRKALTCCSNDWVYVLNGDTFLDVEFDTMDSVAVEASASVKAVIATKEMRDFDRYGTMNVAADGTVLAFNEKMPCAHGNINAGAYLIRCDCLASYPEAFSLESDCFERIVAEGAIKAVSCAGDFIDIGVPEDYELAQTLLASRARRWKLALFDRDGTLNVDTGHLFEPEKLELIDEGVKLLKRYSDNPNYKVAIVTNQAGIAKGYYTESDMRKLHAVMEVELERLGCRIDAWYFCPHHPDFTGACECRKPKPGMLLKAIADFDADPSECIMYGDKQKDVDAAIAAGVRGVLVDWS